VKLTYCTPLQPAEASALLGSKIDRPSSVYQIVPGLTSGAPFVGSISDRGFDIHVRRRGANSLAPSAIGLFRPIPAGTEIDVRVGVASDMRHALAVFIGVIGIVSMPAEFSAGVPSVFVLAVAAILIAAAFWIYRNDGEDFGFPSSEAHQLVGLLDETFERRVAKPAGTGPRD
jgi:hypothetical protein